MVEIPGVADAVLDLVAVAVKLPLLRTISHHVTVNVDLDDLVGGGQETVTDTLFQGISVNRFAEIAAVGDLFSFLRRGGEANLCCR